MSYRVEDVSFQYLAGGGLDAEVSGARQRLENVREATGVSVTELARVFGVSRQAAHKWLRGGSLRARHEERLSSLEKVVSAIERAGVSVGAYTYRRTLAGTPSILEQLGKGTDPEELLAKCLPILEEEARQRRELDELFGGRRPKPTASTRFGAPHLREEE